MESEIDRRAEEEEVRGRKLSQLEEEVELSKKGGNEVQADLAKTKDGKSI